ncbi:MAG: DUF6495 family protein [Crocinitomicaceae bacterium]
MKFRMLTKEEMQVFDEDFKHFLIVNGVSNEEWIEMNESNIEKATNLVELFADTVFQKVYEKMKFVEHRSDASCMVFKLNEEDIELISINRKSETVSLATPQSIHEALIKHPNLLTVFKTEKAYSKERELEVHEMISQGCVNSSEAFWMMLEKVIS